MDYRDKVILLTGGTGSFGSSFIRQFLKNNTPKRIRIYSRDEHKQGDLLNNAYYGGILDGFIGDIREKDRLIRAMEGVDIVIHAAALKCVQSCEYNPFETVKTNIIGSMNVLDAALDANVEKVMVVSTDKAVSPLNLYGATKMCMEKLAINANSYRGKKRTKICAVRYGNVAGARGTVIPLWRKSLQEKKPVVITDTQATRFWIDLPEAIDFVTSSLEMMDMVSGGEIFIPKIPSFKVIDLYHAMADGKDYTVIGNRIGDKMHETLVSDEEMRHTVDAADRYIIYPQEPRWEAYKPKGVPCGTRHSYSSDRNEWFLSVKEIKERLEKIG